VVELGRSLVCTSFGTEQVGSGWPSVVLELTARTGVPASPLAARPSIRAREVFWP
jgi:hypothetical protein